MDPIIEYRDSSGRPHWIIERFFAGHRTWIRWTEAELKSRMRQLHDRMVEGDVQIKCRECDANASVVPVFTDRITLCGGYFEKEPSYQAAVFIHELSHETFWTDDDIYGTSPPQPWVASSRKAGYPELVTYGDSFETAEPYEAVTLSVIGEHFDVLFQTVYGAPISKDRYYHELGRVHDGADYRRELNFARSFLEGIEDASSATELDIDVRAPCKVHAAAVPAARATSAVRRLMRLLVMAFLFASWLRSYLGRPPRAHDTASTTACLP